jgi:hypothetical protein
VLSALEVYNGETQSRQGGGGVGADVPREGLCKEEAFKLRQR